MDRLATMVMSASLFAASAAQANLLTNGSFEAGAFVNQGNDTMSLPPGSTVITGWTVVTDTTAWIGPTNPFGLTASEGSYIGLDNVSADLVSAPVPEPGTWALMVAGLAALGRVARRGGRA